MAFAGTRLLKIKIGTTEYNATLSSAVITSEASDNDFVSFADAASGGGRTYKLNFTAKADYAASTLWDEVFSNPGTTVSCVLNPYGVTTFTASEPGFSFDCTVTEPDGNFIGTDADASTTAVSTFECSWVLDAKPTRVTTGTY